MAITKEFVESVRGRLLVEPDISTAKLASELETDEVTVITALPVRIRKKARPQDFAVIWAELGTMAHLPVMPFNEEELGHIWFVSSPEQAPPSHSVRFFDKRGEHIFSVYLDGHEAGSTYNSLCQRFGVTPVPKRHCRGCGNCSCGKARKEHIHAH